MKKTLKLLLAVITLLTSIKLKGQENNQLNQMVNDCLYSYIQHYNNKGKFKIKNFSIDDYPLNFEFDKKISELNLKLISLKRESQPQKTFKKPLLLVFFDGIELNKDSIKITFSNRVVEYIEKRLNLSISDGGTFTYVFSCEKKEWIFVKDHYWGI